MSGRFIPTDQEMVFFLPGTLDASQAVWVPTAQVGDVHPFEVAGLGRVEIEVVEVRDVGEDLSGRTVVIKPVGFDE